MSSINLHFYQSSFKYESRILKETKSLVHSGLINKVIIAGIWEAGCEEHEELDNKRKLWRVPLKTQVLPDGSFWKVLQHIEWAFKIFFKLRKEGIKFVHCHSLSTLPIALLFKIFAQSKVIYDAHELETEKGKRGIRQRVSKLLERLLINYADRTIVVSDSIAGWYQNQYGLEKIHIIKNFPYQENYSSKSCHVLKDTFNIQDNEILYIYHGGLSNGRSIEILLDVFSKVNRKKHIVFMGYGELEDTVKKYEKNFSNIHFHPAVKPGDIISYAKGADVGICMIENICLSYYYSLPNKLFEYVASGLPVIVSDFPDMGKIIDKYKCGWKSPVNEKALIDAIEKISSEEIKDKIKAVLKCKDYFLWDSEEKKLINIYDSLIQES